MINKKETKIGKITYNNNWNLDNRKKIALMRLSEIGVSISSSIGTNNFTLVIPHNMRAPYYIEAGYLVAQLDDKQFPENYSILSETPSRVIYKKEKKERSVEFVDNYPHGLKYRISPIK